MDITERARALRATIEHLAISLDDESAIDNSELFASWSGDNVDYVIGDRVRFDGTLYKCVQSHTSQADWTPASAVSLWARVLIPDPEVIPEWVQPESTNPYMAGDKVMHNGIAWISDVDNNVWEPGVYGWSEYTED